MSGVLVLLTQEFHETTFSKEAKESFFPSASPPPAATRVLSTAEPPAPVTPQKTVATVATTTGRTHSPYIVPEQLQEQPEQKQQQTQSPQTSPTRKKRTSYVPPSPITETAPFVSVPPVTVKLVPVVPLLLVETPQAEPEPVAEPPTFASTTSPTTETTPSPGTPAPPEQPEPVLAPVPPASSPPSAPSSALASPAVSLDLDDLANDIPYDLDQSDLKLIGDIERKEQALTPHFLDESSDTFGPDAVPVHIVSVTAGLQIAMSQPEDAANAEGARPPSPQNPLIPHSVPKDADTTPEPSSLSGMRFDELYRLKGVLGTGAFSTVRAGFHRSNQDISYAVKCINRKKLSEEDEAALLDEVSILKEMKNSHIIRLYDFFEEPSTYYLVMERMRGGELFDRIVAKAYYNEKEARDTCKIVLEAVGYCHFNHVAHRDLKPENLLLLSEEDDSAVKIADFGFAKKVYEHNSLKTQCGTPGYVAPEILEGTPYDERADMWSVGVILYILLGGYPPFIESTQRDLFRKIRKGDYEFHEEYWGTVSTEAKELISSLLTVDCNDRLTAEDALENAWITAGDADLAKKDLGANLEKFRNFNAKRKFRAAVATVMAVNKLNSVATSFFKQLRSNSDADVPDPFPDVEEDHDGGQDDEDEQDVQKD
jgi:calcium/calmodulin-dependent protein kinase I